MPKTKKKQSPLSAFSTLSSGKKLLIFAVIFALIGGAYFAYRSFAATNGTAAFAEQMKLIEGRGKIVTERKGMKRNAKVWELSPGGRVGETFNTGSTERHRACAIFKLPRGGIIEIGSGDGRKGGGTRINVRAGTNDYQKRCDGGNLAGPHINTSIKLINGSDLRVSAISAEKSEKQTSKRPL